MSGHSEINKLVFKTLKRRANVTVIFIAVVFVGIISSCALQMILARQTAAREDLIVNTDISCLVLDSKGMNQNNLGMTSDLVKRLIFEDENGLELYKYVKKLNAKAKLSVSAPSDVSFVRIYSLNSDEALSDLNGARVEFYDGWSEDALTTNEQVCIVPHDYETEINSDGVEVVNILTYRVNEPKELKVIGKSFGVSDVIYVPLFMKMNAENNNEIVIIQSCSFAIKDNLQLDEAKTQLFKEFVRPDPLNINNGYDFGLVVRDEIYKKTLLEIDKNISMMEFIIPIILILMGIIGFMTSFLTTKMKRKEFAVMRCLGMKRNKVFGIVFKEQLFSVVIGAIPSAIIGYLFCGNIMTVLISVFTVAGIFLLGATISTMQATSVNVMQLMKTED